MADLSNWLPLDRILLEAQGVDRGWERRGELVPCLPLTKCLISIQSVHRASRPPPPPPTPACSAGFRRCDGENVQRIPLAKMVRSFHSLSTSSSSKTRVGKKCKMPAEMYYYLLGGAKTRSKKNCYLRQTDLRTWLWFLEQKWRRVSIGEFRAFVVKFFIYLFTDASYNYHRSSVSPSINYCHQF